MNNCRLATLASVAIVSGCVTTGTYSWVEPNSPNSFFHDGSPYVQSALAESIVIMGPDEATQKFNERQRFAVAVFNTGEGRFNFGVDYISAVDQAGRTIDIISPDQLKKEAENQAAWMAVAAGLQAFSNSMNAANAGYYSGYGAYSGSATTFSPYGTYNSSVTGTGFYSGYDSGAAAAAQAAANLQNQQLIQTARENSVRVKQQADLDSLENQTLFPGGDFFGPVILDSIGQDVSQIHVTVQAGRDTHRLSWNFSVQE